jgi:hypothetical protein
MSALLADIRNHIPFDELNDARVCSGQCIGCPKKLLEYLEQEVEHWEDMLVNHAPPKLGDIHKLARSSTKIFNVLQKNEIL